MIVSGWVHRHQLVVIEFLQAENRLLKEKLCGKRIPFTDAERALLARKAKAVGRKALQQLDTIVSPDTLLRWHRQFVAQKWTFVHRRGPGRPRIMCEISELIVSMAQENPGWGYTRIQGAVSNLKHCVGRGTIANILKRSGIAPSPERGKRTPWSTFLKAHWKVLFAADFLTTEVWTARGLVTHYLFFVMSLADRVVAIAGITTRPDEAWMLQVGRNLTDLETGVLRSKQYLIIDRDSKYSAQFRRLLQDGGTKVIRLPPRSPNLNAYAERFVRSIKEEWLDRLIFVGQVSLRRAVTEYVDQYHGERNHQGLENRLLQLATAAATANGSIRGRTRLGGMLNFYYREAA
jgi:transposase InsO family protein